MLSTFDNGCILSNVDNMKPQWYPIEILPGTPGLFILRTRGSEPIPGAPISERIRQTSEDVLQVTQGALYPALEGRSSGDGLI